MITLKDRQQRKHRFIQTRKTQKSIISNKKFTLHKLKIKYTEKITKANLNETYKLKSTKETSRLFIVLFHSKKSLLTRKKNPIGMSEMRTRNTPFDI